MSKNNHYIVVASEDGIRLWDLLTQKVKVNYEGYLKRRKIGVMCIFNNSLWIAGEDCELKEYDLNSGKLKKVVKL